MSFRRRLGAVRKDLNARSVENISGGTSESEILDILAKYGIYPGKVELWGTGKPLREFLWSEEMADASVYVMEKVDFADLVLLPAISEIRILI